VPAAAGSLTASLAPAAARAESVQDVPLNIAAVGGEQIEEQGFEVLRGKHQLSDREKLGIAKALAAN
jgi:hypothetical protein